MQVSSLECSITFILPVDSCCAQHKFVRLLDCIEMTHQPSLQQVNITQRSGAKKITDGSVNREKAAMSLQTAMPSRRQSRN